MRANRYFATAMLIASVASANAADQGNEIQREFLISNNDVEMCVGTTNTTQTLPFPPGSKVQHLVPCLSNGLTRWRHMKQERLYNKKQNTCLGVLNKRYGTTIFWPVITNSCNAPYTRWIFEYELHTPESKPTQFKVKNIDLGTCLGVIEPASESPVVVLVNCDDQLYTTWSKH